MGKVLAEITEFEGIPLARLTELAQAEREGRVVVLPCKVGDTIYCLHWRYDGIQAAVVESIRVYEDIIVVIVTFPNDHDCGYTIEDFGRTVFLTRPEAEAKLKEMEGLDV